MCRIAWERWEFDTRSGTPEELAQALDGDLKRWGKVVRDGNIQAQ